MVKGLICSLMLVVSISAYANENSISLNKSTETTIARLENKQVKMIAKILHKKGRGMIDQKIKDDQKLANQSYTKQNFSNLIEAERSSKFPN